MPVHRWAAVTAVTLALLSSPLAAGAAEAPSSGKDYTVAGIYSDQWETTSDLAGLAAASGKPVSLAGTFHLLEESEAGWPGTTDWLLETAWAAQATPLANVNVTVPAAVVASGAHDAQILAWASRVKGWLDRGGGRSLLIAPMQEMNGDWVPYGMDPASYQLAFRRFVELFRSVGIDETKARWVFAPNSWSTWPYRIADYYPGHDVVDLLGISAYNFGSLVDRWTPLDQAVVGLAELRAIAPYKPFLLTQVGSSTAGGDRDEWIRQLFHLTAVDPNLVGFVYFNFMKETDWKVWDGASLAQGWWDGMQMPSTVHSWPLTQWFQPGPLPFAPYDGTFADDDLLAAQPDIEWLVAQDISRGCTPELFCPHQPITRGEFATFLVRAFGLPPSAGNQFADDDGSANEIDIETVASAGIAEGCGPAMFCPDALLTRQELASAFARALGLASIEGPSPFRDPAEPAHHADIQALVSAGITEGCAPDLFCPLGAVSRHELATFLRRALETTPPPAPAPVETPPPPPRPVFVRYIPE